MKLGQNIKQFRTLNHLTQVELAKRVGIPRSTLQKYESGSIQCVTVTVVEAIGNALHVSPNELIGWNYPNPVTNNLVDAFIKLNPSDQELVIRLLARLSEIK